MILAQGFQMQKSHLSQFFSGIGELAQLPPRPADEAMEGGIDAGHEQLIFILEVQIDGAVSDSGAVRNLRNAGMEEAFLRDDLNGGIQDALVLV